VRIRYRNGHTHTHHREQTSGKVIYMVVVTTKECLLQSRKTCQWSFSNYLQIFSAWKSESFRPCYVKISRKKDSTLSELWQVAIAGAQLQARCHKNLHKHWASISFTYSLVHSLSITKQLCIHSISLFWAPYRVETVHSPGEEADKWLNDCRAPEWVH
jgi:hypothetical protein